MATNTRDLLGRSCQQKKCSICFTPLTFEQHFHVYGITVYMAPFLECRGLFKEAPLPRCSYGSCQAPSVAGIQASSQGSHLESSVARTQIASAAWQSFSC